ncbi:MAG: glycosyltransferase [Candidatus Levybacteria bacterium]|nr:glycosyltransferase [Candidatus Levybacteria bacterium]
MMKISFITTVLNEEETIEGLLEGLKLQSKLPDEVIIVDGGSRDNTLSVISNFQFPISNKKIKIIQKKGNRSQGRNTAIKNSSGDIIICTDAGCIPDKDWIKNITKEFEDKEIDVVAGFYKPKTNGIFEKCLSTYTCVMPDKIDPDNFLPSSRSIGFKKSVWDSVKYPEWLDTCEDLYFSRELKRRGFKFAFAKNAIVYWRQKKNLLQAFFQLLGYAIGDGRAFYIRPQVPLVYLRYFFALYFLFLSILERSLWGILILIALFLAYILWSIKKNYRYLGDKKAFIILPALQITADVAVVLGTTFGLLKRALNYNFLLYIKRNKFLVFMVLAYSAVMLLTLRWGIPNENHPYPYHMDEWHQLQAVRATVKFGTPNVFGSANGTMLHFILSAFYLVPFTLLQIIDPVVLKVSDLIMRERVFEILRLNTIFFGVLSAFTIHEIAKRIKASKSLVLMLFILTPVWMMLSGYFKYDISLMFWILLSILFLVRFIKDPSNRNYVLAALPCALAFSVKPSAIPLLLIYVVSFFWFKNQWRKNLKYFAIGLSVYGALVALFGIPDTLFGKGNIYNFFYENVISTPMTTQNFDLGMNSYVYLLFRHYPIIFGHGLMVLFLASCIFWVYLFIHEGIKKSAKRYKIELFMFFSLVVFLISLVPLQIYAGGNRSLVLLPFLALIPSLIWPRMKQMRARRAGIGVAILLALSFQIYESASWVYLRLIKSPQEIASEWIIKNIPEKTLIGLENVPIYQGIPDILQKEFYFDQANVGAGNIYKYEIVSAKSSELPSVIVIANGEIEMNLLKNSVKKDLLKRMEREGFKKIIVFTPGFKYFKISEIDYYFSWLIASPNTISVYSKNN